MPQQAVAPKQSVRATAERVHDVLQNHPLGRDAGNSLGPLDLPVAQEEAQIRIPYWREAFENYIPPAHLFAEGGCPIELVPCVIVDEFCRPHVDQHRLT